MSLLLCHVKPVKYKIILPNIFLQLGKLFVKCQILVSLCIEYSHIETGITTSKKWILISLSRYQLYLMHSSNLRIPRQTLLKKLNHDLSVSQDIILSNKHKGQL